MKLLTRKRPAPAPAEVIDLREHRTPACPNCGGHDWTERSDKFECDACGFWARPEPS